MLFHIDRSDPAVAVSLTAQFSGCRNWVWELTLLEGEKSTQLAELAAAD